MSIIKSEKKTHKKRVLFLILLVLIGFFSSFTTFGQTLKEKNITLNIRNESLVNVLSKISSLTNYKFFYEQETVDRAPRVSIDLNNATIQLVIEQIAAQTHLYFHKTDNTISVSNTPPMAQQPQEAATTKIVVGKITDEKGEAIIGANVIEKGTLANGTVTDFDGRFSLKIAPQSVLQISYIGYLPQEIVPDGKIEFNIVLVEDTKTLDEVVVVGYGTMKKSDLTGAISNIKAEELSLTGNASVMHAISGKVSGLYTRQNSAQPGGGIDILVRGAGSINASNRPLYIVDGFPISQVDDLTGTDAKMNPGTQGVLNFLNPNDIESIEVLKDASATSIYGARAANGVILITTKRGKTGRIIVSYSANYSLQRYVDKYDLLPLNEWMEVNNSASYEEWLWKNKVTPWGTVTLDEARTNPVGGIGYTKPYSDTEIANAGRGTDWLGLITRNGQIHEHNVNVRGGSENTIYNISLNYYNHSGIIRNTGLKRYTVKSNVDQKINSAIKMGLNLTLSRLNNENSQLGNGRFENSGIIRSAIAMGPQIKAYDEKTNTYPINPLVGTQANPYSLLNNIDKTNTDRLLGNIFVEITPLEGLLLRVNTGLDRVAMSRDTYQPKTTLNGGKLRGVASIYSQDNNQYLAEATANYTKIMKEIHSLNILAGTSYEEYGKKKSNLGNNDFITDAFIYHNMGAGVGTKVVGSGYAVTKMQSYFFRLNYVLKNRYLLNATLRADGASVFPVNNKWGYFPSIAAGWTISREDFMKELTWIESLKLRASWGQTGNADIGIYAYPSYAAIPAYTTGKHIQETGVFLKRLGNPDLKWETTTEFNVGIDFGLFGGRIRGSFEYYNKVISDLLNYKYLNIYHSVDKIMANVGKTQSRGIELNLNTKNIETKHFSWSTDFTYTKFNDRWKERTPDWKPNVYEKSDDPIRPVFSRLSDHIMQIGETTPKAQPKLVPGQIVIRDINGYKRDSDNKLLVDENGHFILTGKPDGVIDDADTKLIGTKDPGWIAGMTNNFRYKNFDLSCQLSGMFNRFMMNPTYMDFGIGAGGVATHGYNMLRKVKDRWTFDNPSTTHPSSYVTTGHNYTYGDFFYEKAWFIRVQNISLGYTLPQKITSKIDFISSLRVHANINNLYVFTPYSGQDPETDSYAAAYPNARTFSLGFEIQF